MSFSIGHLICLPHLILPPALGSLLGFPSVSHVVGENWLHSWCRWAGWAMRVWQPPPLTKTHFCPCSQEFWVGSVVFPSSKLTEEKRALCGWALAKCFKGFLLCGLCRTVQGSPILEKADGPDDPSGSLGVLFHMDPTVPQPRGHLWSPVGFCFQFSLHRKTLQHPTGCWPWCFGSTPSHFFRLYH